MKKERNIKGSLRKTIFAEDYIKTYHIFKKNIKGRQEVRWEK